MNSIAKLYLLLLLSGCVSLFSSCSGDRLEEKGFAVSEAAGEEEGAKDGIAKDSLSFKTRPSSVLLTGSPEHRLTTVYKVNYTKDNKRGFIGSNSFYRNYDEYYNSGANRGHYNFMPGLEAVYGYNLVNVSHYNTLTKSRNDFFQKPVLIKTLYYPSFSSDTLYNKPVKREYYLLSVYDEDTNDDGYINMKDLRRLYRFDMNATSKQPLVPLDYSVVSSEYDPANDYMYVFAQKDTNQNGRIDEGEDTHIYWVDLKDALSTGREY